MKSSIDLESSIANYLNHSKRFYETPFTAQEIFEDFSELYIKQRIDGAKLDFDGDMILVEWGQMQKREPRDSGPIDDRQYDGSSSKNQWSSEKFPYIGMTRQVHISTEDPDDFDGNAIAMYMTMHFEPGDLESGNHWIDIPDSVVEFQSLLKQKDDLNRFWKIPTTSIIAGVGTVG